MLTASSLSQFGLSVADIRMLAYVGLVHFAVVFCLWIIGRGHRNDSVLDVYWGFSFAVAVWIAYEFNTPESARSRLVLTLATVWAGRLGYHLFSRWARIHGSGGDLRYQDIKDKLSSSGCYALKSLFLVYVPMWFAYVLAQLNMVLTVAARNQPPLTVLDLVCAVGIVCAIVLETAADLQLDAFKASPHSHGKVLDTGVWAWSRHPNYFANCCCFWGFFGMSLQIPHLWWTIISPLFMTWLLVGFTGKRWMESHMRKRRPEYADYIARTSGFIPMPPRRHRS